MRAARLLRILLILQNRGRATAGHLAAELEVAARTILRDVDALTEAGLPVVVHRGQAGGIELAFDYRTRLTGLDADEAEAMGVLLSADPPGMADLGLSQAAARARAKVWEAFPDQTRLRMATARSRFRTISQSEGPDARRLALATAVRESRVVRLCAHGPGERVVHPVALTLAADGWVLHDGLGGETVAEALWGRINVSARRFAKGSP